jgi:hypothetical protein
MPSSGFAIMSLAAPMDGSVVRAILSFAVLNAATPVLIAVVSFGWLIWLVERRANPEQFTGQHIGVYFGFVAMSTMGFGGARPAVARSTRIPRAHTLRAPADVTPASRVGRLLVIMFCIVSVLSLSAFTSVVSSRLTVAQLSHRNINALNQLTPPDICIEAAYPLIAAFVSDEFGLDGDLLRAGVMVASPEACAQAVLSGAVIAYVTDAPLLNWLAFSYYGTGQLYVSPVVRANPLSFAYPAGSTLRPVIDRAVMTFLTNTTWLSAKSAIEDTWLAKGEVLPPTADESLSMPTFITACVMVGVFLGVDGGQRVVERVRRRRQRRVALQRHSGGGGGADAAAEAAEAAEAAASAADARADGAVASAHAAARAAAAAAAAAEALARELEAMRAEAQAVSRRTLKADCDDGKPRTPTVSVTEL